LYDKIIPRRVIMEYKHLSEIPENIRQPYIRQTDIDKIQKKLLNKINYIKLLKLEGVNTYGK
jgi:hypothetical protein